MVLPSKSHITFIELPQFAFQSLRFPASFPLTAIFSANTSRTNHHECKHPHYTKALARINASRISSATCSTLPG